MPRAVSLTDKLLGTYKDRLGEVALVPSTGGAFEISVDGNVIFSKLQEGRFPEERVIVREIGEQL